MLRVVPQAPPPPEPWWVDGDYADGMFTAADHWAAEVMGNPAPPAERIEAARAFYRVHGDRALLDALAQAEDVYGALPPELAGVRARLTYGQAA